MSMRSALFSVTVTIAALCLITLHNEALAMNCDEQNWNRALKRHKILESQYNHHAIRFNQTVETFNAQPFLHKEFSYQEIIRLWQQQNTEVRNKLSSHVTAARDAIQRLERETEKVISLQQPTDEQIRQWREIHNSCLVHQYKVNSAVSQQYVTNSIQLRGDLTQLANKLSAAISQYEKEVNVLESAQATGQMAMENKPPP